MTFRPYWFSRPAQSTTLTRLLNNIEARGAWGNRTPAVGVLQTPAFPLRQRALMKIIDIFYLNQELLTISFGKIRGLGVSRQCGGVAERLNAQVSKTCIAEMLSRVQISPPPRWRESCNMMIKPVVIALIKKGNKYLLTKRVDLDPEDKEFYPFVWQFPGGGMEFGEKPEETLIREMLEEIGVKVEIVALIPKIEVDIRGHWQGLFICYLCKLKDENSKIILNEEASEYAWYTISEIKRLKVLPKTVDMAIAADKISS